MKKTKKCSRPIAILLTLIMLFGMLPVSALAVSMEAQTYWDGSVATSFSGGSGTQADPYMIADGSELALLSALIADVSTNPEFSPGHYILIADIDMGGSENNFTPIGFNNAANQRFVGHFDGNNHIISNLHVSRTVQTAGLFGFVRNTDESGVPTGGGLRNIVLKDPVISNTALYTGGLVGWVVGQNSANPYPIENCAVINARITSASNFVGGIAGSASNSAIRESYAIAEITGNGTNRGGLLGTAATSAVIEHSFARGSLRGSGTVGGFIGGTAPGSLTIRYSYADVSVEFTAAGNVGAFGLVTSFLPPAAAVMTNNYFNSGARIITANTGTPITLHRFTAMTEDELKSDETVTLLNAGGEKYAIASEYQSANDGFPYLPGTYTEIIDLIQLETPVGIAWLGDTAVAAWQPVLHAEGYRIVLFKGGNQVVTAQVEKDVLSLDLTGDIGLNGSGDYTFAVVALGDGRTTRSSAQSEQSTVYNATVTGADVTFNINLPDGMAEYRRAGDPVITVSVGTTQVNFVNGVAKSLPVGSYSYTIDALGFTPISGIVAVASDAVTINAELYNDSGWDGTSTIEPQLADGVYQIASGYELAWFRDRVNLGGANFTLNAQLVNDISLDSHEWIPISRFTESGANVGYSGTFDGQGHRVRNLSITTGADGSGLFGYLFAATVRNLTVDGSIIAGQHSGGIAGVASGGGSTSSFTPAPATGTTISNCISYVDITVNRNLLNSANNIMVGGVVGNLRNNAFVNTAGIIENSANYGTIVGGNNGYIGGIVGNAANGLGIRNSANYGNISGRGWIGGIAGTASNVTVSGCYNAGTITGSPTGGNSEIQIGGIAGFSNGIIADVYNTGAVSGRFDVGGIVGRHQNTAANTNPENNLFSNPQVTNAYNSGVISATEISTGGAIVGSKNSAEIGGQRIFNTYFLSGTAPSGVGNNAHEDDEAISKTAEELTEPGMAQLLGSAFIPNMSGFPLLSWQGGGSVDPVVSFALTPAGAAVEVRDSADNVMTPMTGTANSFMLPDGVYTYEVTSEGYISETGDIEVAGAGMTITVVLTKEPFTPADDPVTVRFSAANADGTGFIYINEALEVMPGIAAYYGYSNDSSVIPAGEISALDVLVAAHISVYGEDIAALRAQFVFSGWITRVFGVTTSNVSTFVNAMMPNDGTLFSPTEYNGASIAQAKVTEGDLVQFFFNQSTWPNSDTYTWFESSGVMTTTVSAVAGEPLNVTLRGYPGAWGFNVNLPLFIAPVTNASIVPLTIANEGSGSLGSQIAATNAQGVAALIFNNPGVYVLSARATGATAGGNNPGGTPLMLPWLIVTVTEAPPDIDADILAVIALIDALPDSVNEITLSHRQAVSDAKSAFDALSQQQQEQIEQVKRTKLANAVSRIADIDAAAVVAAIINALPEAENINLSDEPAVEAAREAYDSLTAVQRTLVDEATLDKLLAAQAKIAELKGARALMPTPAEVSEVLERTAAYQFETVTAPTVGTDFGEWTVLALARGGFITEEFTHIYLSNLHAHLQANDGKLSSGGANHTEYSRVILALTALGADPSDIFGYNLLAPLAEFENLTRQGLNSITYALIALNSGNYDIPTLPAGQTYTQTTHQLLITFILSAQQSDGRWDITPGNVDATAMAIQALAPYYGQNSAVTAAIDNALAILSQMQYPTGGFGSAESNAQVIVALNELGIPLDDRAFVKTANTIYDELLTFFNEATGAFRRSGADDPIATDQAMYALVSVYRALTGANTLYDMSDVSKIDTDGIAPAPVDRTALIAAIARAEEFSSVEYTSASWSVLTNALSIARAVLENPNSVQGEVNAAAAGLNSAINTLTPVRPGETPANYVWISVTDPNASGNQTRVYFQRTRMEMNNNESAYTLLLRTGLTVRTSSTTQAGVYVVSINGFGEFDDGPLSGWMFRVIRNGATIFPTVSASSFLLQDGDTVEWVYTRQLGSDVGGGAAGGAPIATQDEDDDEENEEDGTLSNTDIPLAEFENWENPFTDVSEDAWYYEAVRFANVLGLMTGTAENRFSPNLNLSRAMMITILARTAGIDTTTGETWYSEAVSWGVSNGITDGTNLTDDITREQFVTMIFRYAELIGQDTSERANLDGFEDAGSISYWARDAMAWAVSLEIIRGRTETTIVPGATATRAEAAVILMRFLSAIS